MQTKICTKCGRELPATSEYFHKHKKNTDGLRCRCKECACEDRRKAYIPKKRKTHQNQSGRQLLSEKEYQERALNSNPDIEIQSRYLGMNKRIKLKCKKCGHDWNPVAKSIISGHGCPVCAHKVIAKRTKKTHQEFVAELKDKKPNITAIGKYKTARTKMLFKCRVDGYEWLTTPDVVLRGNRSKGCPQCNGAIKNETTNHFILRMKKVNPEVLVLGQYIDSETPILCSCKKCFHEWSPIPKSLIAGHGCPVCRQSKGEKFVSGYLKEKNIEYLYQHKFANCLNKRTLAFDFYLPKLDTVIEYDGVQHFKPVKHFGGETGFRKTRKRDIIKDNYCRENNIELIRIPYSVEKIEKYLDEHFTKMAEENGGWGRSRPDLGTLTIIIKEYQA